MNIERIIREGEHNLTNLELLENAIADGYNVLFFDNTITLGVLQRQHSSYLKSGYKPESIDSFIEVFNIQTKKEVLLDPKNNDKMLIVLKNGVQQIEILTSDIKCIDRARKQRAYQNEPTDFLVHVEFVAFGGSSNPYQIAYMNKITAQLQGFKGWKFADKEIGRFSATKKTGSIIRQDAEKALEELEFLFDYISLTRQIGIRVEHSAISPIPRFGPVLGVTGPLEYLVPSLKERELEKFNDYLKLPEQVLNIVKELNETYLLRNWSSRLALLWAITEATFMEKQVTLLSEKEIIEILGFAEKISTLKEDKKRLEELKKVLTNPSRLPSKGRNEIIANNISLKVGLEKEKILAQVKQASEARGKHFHELKGDRADIQRAEGNLRITLETYLRSLLDF